MDCLRADRATFPRNGPGCHSQPISIIASVVTRLLPMLIDDRPC
jgi:hypothetical protein